VRRQHLMIETFTPASDRSPTDVLRLTSIPLSC